MKRRWHRRISLIVCALSGLFLATAVFSQATDTPPQRTVEDGWQVVNTDAEDDLESRYVVFIPLEDGSILEVAGGADVVWFPSEDSEGVYTGQSLIPLQDVDTQATLTLVDDETRSVTSVTKTGALTLESEIQYVRSDLRFEVWVEQSRDLSEYTLFGPCLGVELRDSPRTFSRVDPILPVLLDEDTGTLILGLTTLTGDGGTYERVSESPFGAFTQVISQTAIVDASTIALSYHAIADNRDDCEVVYVSVFVPFDGDFETLFEAAAELAEE